MIRPIQRIAIVNRGEAAMRLIHAVRELNEEHGGHVRTIALYTEPDRQALFVRAADEAVLLGPVTVVDPTGVRRSTYVDHLRLERGLLEARADAAWVGWGFVAEDARFAELCERLGIVFIGPSPKTMRLLGDKIAAKRLAAECGVAVGPWSGGPVETVDDAHREGARLGYPLMVKAAAGGGGRGIRAVASPAGLTEAFQRAQSEARIAFGDSTLFLERLLPGGRHVEVQILADGAGTTWALGVRDCSVQRRHQKIIEESASTALTAGQAERLCGAAVRLCERAGYRGAGTVEFLLEVASGAISFMEVNPRLQVEHPVTEMTTGVDLVKLQLHIAQGGVLEGQPPTPRGHAVEARLCAEDPDNEFAPSPGTVAMFSGPSGPGIRVDSGIVQGDHVVAEFDSMMAKIVAWGRDRDEALARLRRGLAETKVVIQGGTTNRAFLLELLGRPEVRGGTADVGWLDRTDFAASWPRPHADVALIVAAVEVDHSEMAIDRARFLATASRGRPEVRDSVGRVVELSMNGHRHRLHVQRLGPGICRVELDGGRVDVEAERLGIFERRVKCQGEVYRALCVDQGGSYLVEVDGVQHRADRDDGGIVRARSPAVVVELRVSAGDTVCEGDVVAVLEAMKMEMPLLAPVSGTVTRVMVQPNVQVNAGAALLQIEAARDDAGTRAARGERICLPEATAADADPRRRCRQALDVLRLLMLGYDVDRATATAALADHAAACALGISGEAWLRSAEDEVLGAFADVCALSRRRPEATDDITGPGLSDQELLFAYLRTLDPSRLSASLADSLPRALSHYGIDSLVRTPELEDRLYWLVRSQQRAEIQIPVMLSLLDHLEKHAGELAADAGDDLRVILDRVHAAARHRHPAVADLAREVRHRYFEQPLLEKARDAVYEDVRVRLDNLEQQAETDREQCIAALVACPQPLHNLLTARFPDATVATSAVMLEVLTRRYYRTRDLGRVPTFDLGGRPFAVADHSHRNLAVRAITTFALMGELTAALAALPVLLADLPEHAHAVADAYVWRSDSHDRGDVLARKLRAAIGAAGLPPTVRRVVIMVTEPRLGLGMSSAQHFTFRRHGNGYREESLYRGLHPMMAERLQVSRLGNFRIERLPSVEDVYCFHGVARENPRDERLFVMAEVRDVTPVRDAAGRVVGLPSLERVLAEALARIRHFQLRRSPELRVQWNRVLLYVWPPLELALGEIRDIAARLGPETEDLGLEEIGVNVTLRNAVGELRPAVLHLSHPLGAGAILMRVTKPSKVPLQPLDEYTQKVVSMRRRGLVYPYEIVTLLAPSADAASGGSPPGGFVEHDLDADGHLVPVVRPAGHNSANLVVGLIRNHTEKHPEGMVRVIVLGDPSRSLGALAEPECRRIMAALDLAESMDVPVEWFTLSSGARISMESGTENMDWIARVLRRVIEFTQRGGEINLIVNAINVGAQPYWNAEATMLMHTRGILVMTPQGAMVLTGKQALEYSGSVSAEDNFGIGGYDRIMGPNGQAQYWAGDLAAACTVLLRHYEHTYRAPGERFPRRSDTRDPFDRDAGLALHPHGSGSDFGHVGDIFSNDRNPDRKKPFDIRAVMGAVVDQDHPPLERWTDMEHADTAVVWDAHLGGYPVCLIGIQSQPVIRHGFIPADGPDHWTSGTLFPQSSKKIARAINAASDNRPLVFLANLSGFDGSPESMRRLQLEFGAEIGRAVVNFRGPMVFCVISRYHGGAFVVFSATLNESLEVAAVEGSFASVIGGAPAAAVVFTREVEDRTKADPRVVELVEAIDAAIGAEKAPLRARIAAMLDRVRHEKLGEVAAEFDSVHTVQRAQRMGSVHRIIPAETLRPYLIDAVERGIRKELDSDGVVAATGREARTGDEPAEFSAR